jgi:hypothetical protein
LRLQRKQWERWALNCACGKWDKTAIHAFGALYKPS